MEFLNEKENDTLLKKLSGTKSSDIINLDSNCDAVLTGLWKKHVKTPKNTPSIPSDLFFAGTIPLRDCDIVVDADNPAEDTKSYRVAIFEDYGETMRVAGDEVAMVGAIVKKLPVAKYNHGTDAKLILPIYVVRGRDYIIIGPVGYKGMPEPVRNHMASGLAFPTILDWVGCMMDTWYGIQIALLHPQIKEVFQNPVKTVVENDTKVSKGKKKKNRVKYIKRHVVNKDELDKLMLGDEKTPFTRHTLAWYVIGHWRKYNDGKKVFIQPYWKGVLREIKAGAERERVIAPAAIN